jgi:lysophospholipase L1-like esterase
MKTATVMAAYLVANLALPAASRELSEQRFSQIKSEISKTPQAVIVLGDSIVEGAILPASLCGHNVVNAGVTGAGIDYFHRYADELISSAQPSLIVLAVGVNDTGIGDDVGRAPTFRSAYEATAAALIRNAPLVVTTIAPIQSSSYSRPFSALLVPILNEIIKGVPHIKALIDVNTPLTRENFTSDGIHLNAEGNAIWSGAVSEGISRALGCER